MLRARCLVNGIYDGAGRQLYNKRPGSATSEVLTLRAQVQSLRPGIYFIRVSYEGKMRIAKVVKL